MRFFHLKINSRGAADGARSPAPRGEVVVGARVDSVPMVGSLLPVEGVACKPKGENAGFARII